MKASQSQKHAYAFGSQQKSWQVLGHKYKYKYQVQVCLQASLQISA